MVVALSPADVFVDVTTAAGSSGHSQSWFKQRSEAFWMSVALIVFMLVFGLLSGKSEKHLAPEPLPPVQKSAVPANKIPNKQNTDSGLQRYPFVYSVGVQRTVVRSFSLRGVEVRPGDIMFVTDMLTQNEFGIAVERNGDEIVAGKISLQSIEERTR